MFVKSQNFGKKILRRAKREHHADHQDKKEMFRQFSKKGNIQVNNQIKTSRGSGREYHANQQEKSYNSAHVSEKSWNELVGHKRRVLFEPRFSEKLELCFQLLKKRIQNWIRVVKWERKTSMT